MFKKSFSFYQYDKVNVHFNENGTDFIISGFLIGLAPNTSITIQNDTHTIFIPMHNVLYMERENLKGEV